MLSYNKKIAKVSFFLFLFFSFFALGFTITNVSAYTSEDMPAGYRVITYEDQGKVFGVDLLPVVYFDTSFTSIPSSETFMLFTLDASDTNKRILLYTNGDIFFKLDSSTSVAVREYSYSSSSVIWNRDSYSLPEGLIVNFISESSVSNFSFLYVKDNVPVPTLIESILSLFNNLVIWIPSVITGLIALFYSSESGLTFLGALAVAGLGISVIFLLIGIIQNFLHFRG